jgi:Dynamin central region
MRATEGTSTQGLQGARGVLPSSHGDRCNGRCAGLAGVVNRSQQDIASHMSMREARAAEAAFFQSHPEYGDVLGQCGMPALARCLNRILVEHIRATLPDLRSSLEQALEARRSELKIYGDAPPGQTGAARCAPPFSSFWSLRPFVSSYLVLSIQNIPLFPKCFYFSYSIPFVRGEHVQNSCSILCERFEQLQLCCSIPCARVEELQLSCSISFERVGQLQLSCSIPFEMVEQLHDGLHLQFALQQGLLRSALSIHDSWQA